MRFQQELQQMLQVQSLPSLSHAALGYLEACMLSSLTDLIIRLKYLLRQYSKLPATSTTAGSSVSPLPYGALLLLLHLHNEPRFYRLASFLSLEEARKKAKESASGASELDMLNDNDETVNEGEHFADAWLGNGSGAIASTSSTTATASSATASGTIITNASVNTDFSPATLPQAFLTTDVISIFRDDPGLLSLRQSNGEDGPEAILKKKLPPGFLEHLRRLQAAEAVTVNMSPSEYIQYAEARAQAGFTHHKMRSKRFKDFITPHLSAHDIPFTDELLDILGFLAHEIVFDLIEQGKDSARKRINLLRRDEIKARRAAIREAVKKNKTANGSSLVKRPAKATSGKSKKTKNVKSKDGQNRSAVQSKKEEEEEALKEAERMLQSKKEEAARVPDGPFTAPAGMNITHGLIIPAHCPADADAPSELPDDDSMPSNLATEHTKVDNTTTHATIASAYDVLLGDFEEGFHFARRDGWERVAPSRRRRKFMDLFR